jgi:hypothetical protein
MLYLNYGSYRTVNQVDDGTKLYSSGFHDFEGCVRIDHMILDLLLNGGILLHAPNMFHAGFTRILTPCAYFSCF